MSNVSKLPIVIESQAGIDASSDAIAIHSLAAALGFSSGGGGGGEQPVEVSADKAYMVIYNVKEDSKRLPIYRDPKTGQYFPDPIDSILNKKGRIPKRNWCSLIRIF